MPLNYQRYNPYEYKKGQTYDPYSLPQQGLTPGIPGKTAALQKSTLGKTAAELGKEFAWMYGGRPLTQQEMELLMPAGYDPRMGTIGGMTITPTGTPATGLAAKGLKGAPGQATGAYAATAYKPIRGFGATDKATGQPMFPVQEVGPTPAAIRDQATLAELPYNLMEQYRRVADQGLYGVAGMNQIIQAGITPAIERTKAMTGEALTAVRATRMQTVNQGARMLAEKLGGQFASQPGLAMKLMGDQIIAPSLAKEMEASIDLKVNETNILNALDGAIGDLIRANEESKAMGLAGIENQEQFLQNRAAQRWWDLSMENKFGWSPERTAAARTTAEQSLMNLQQHYNMSSMRMQSLWQDWLNERTYNREEYGSSSGERGNDNEKYYWEDKKGFAWWG